jgi:hypothetical protein
VRQRTIDPDCPSGALETRRTTAFSHLAAGYPEARAERRENASERRAERRRETMAGISLDQKDVSAPVGDRAAGARPRGEPFVLRPEVRRLASLSFVADTDFLALARMTAMHVAGLVGLPIGRVTDLRLAVDEACSLFLADPGGPMPAAKPRVVPAGNARPARGMVTLQFDRHGDMLRIRVSGPAPARRPDEDDLGWTMLCALVGEPRWETRGDVGTLTMTEPIPTARR